MFQELRTEWLGMVARVYNPSTQEAEVEGAQV
jgi:hypothetical protein